jgi:cell division protein FtsB
MLRWVALVLLILLIALQVHLWTGQGGLREVWRLEQSVATQKAENARLKKRNETLSAEVEDLKHGEEAIEERARSELGLLKPGETFYQVVEPRAADNKPGDEANANGKH